MNSGRSGSSQGIRSLKLKLSASQRFLAGGLPLTRRGACLPYCPLLLAVSTGQYPWPSFFFFLFYFFWVWGRSWGGGKRNLTAALKSSSANRAVEKPQWAYGKSIIQSPECWPVGVWVGAERYAEEFSRFSTEEYVPIGIFIHVSWLSGFPELPPATPRHHRGWSIPNMTGPRPSDCRISRVIGNSFDTKGWIMWPKRSTTHHRRVQPHI